MRVMRCFLGSRTLIMSGRETHRENQNLKMTHDVGHVSMSDRDEEEEGGIKIKKRERDGDTGTGR